MKGRQRQVQCITTGIGGHHLVPDVRLHDLGNSRLDGQERQAMNKGQPLRAALCMSPVSSSSTAGLVTSSYRLAASAHHCGVQFRRATISGAARPST